jgi:queuine/archaeosine tRNA-ribosyltransferase
VQIETPALVTSYRIRDYPQAGLRCHPWQMTGTEALLLNAFDMLANKRTQRFTGEIRQHPGKLHEYVEFAGPLMLDSGAFNFLQHHEISITPIDVLDIGLELGTDISVVLDHPFPPNSSPQEIKARWANTRANTQAMVKALADRDGKIPNGFQLMPVLHGHDAETLKRSLDDIVAILGQEPSLVGIGSLAPLAQNGSKQTAVDVIISVRQLLPDTYIHCFSMGSALLMLFAFYCGADTVDSQTWIMSAAFKQVQLPGFYLTRLSPHEAERDPAKYRRIRLAFAQHLLQLIKEENFVVRDWDTGVPWPISDGNEALAYLDYLEDRDGINHIHRRACHNLYAFNFEAGRVREVMAEGEVETFIQSRMQSTQYRRAFEYAVNRKMAVR